MKLKILKDIDIQYDSIKLCYSGSPSLGLTRPGLYFFKDGTAVAVYEFDRFDKNNDTLIIKGLKGILEIVTSQ
jgi:hypothetical protein